MVTRIKQTRLRGYKTIHSTRPANHRQTFGMNEEGVFDV